MNSKKKRFLQALPSLLTACVANRVNPISAVDDLSRYVGFDHYEARRAYREFMLEHHHEYPWPAPNCET